MQCELQGESAEDNDELEEEVQANQEPVKKHRKKEKEAEKS